MSVLRRAMASKNLLNESVLGNFEGEGYFNCFMEEFKVILLFFVEENSIFGGENYIFSISAGDSWFLN